MFKNVYHTHTHTMMMMILNNYALRKIYIYFNGQGSV